MTGLSAAAAETLALHRRRVRRRVALMALLGALALAALLLDLATGPAGMPLGETLRALTGGEVSRGASVIVWQVRLPMALMAQGSCTTAKEAFDGAKSSSILGERTACAYVPRKRRSGIGA